MSDNNPTLSGTSYIHRIDLVKGDVTQIDDVDAIASCIGTDLEIRGGLNTTLIECAGYPLNIHISEQVYKPHAGDAVAVPGHDLKVPTVIFAIVPDWRTDFDREDRDLLRCYRSLIEMAQKMQVSSVAIPALGMGSHHGFPVKRAVRLAIQGILDRLTGHLSEIKIVCNSDETYNAFEEALGKWGWVPKL